MTDGAVLVEDGRDVAAEGGRLLGEYHTRVRRPEGADAFECMWFLTEAAALEGLFMPESAILFIPRALQRCPTTARLHLAHAFVSEQQWLRGGLTPAQELEVVRRYEEAMKFSETEPEARFEAQRELQRQPRDASRVRLRNRDTVDGRPRGYFRRFGLSRVRLREMAHKGELPGVTKSSW